MYEVKVIADSISPTNRRITTLEVVMPRIVLAEFNTHRLFTRNSASSRAIPFKKMLRSVMTTPFVPLRWMKDHSGMQGTEYYRNDDHFHFESIQEYLFDRFKVKDDTDDDYRMVTMVLMRLSNRPEFRGRKTLTEWWLTMRDMVVDCAALMFCFNVSKQVCNRLLEPFMWHRVLVTSTEWENFFALRWHEHAEIHIQEVARRMMETMNASIPKALKAGEWHIPYSDQISKEQVLKEMKYDPTVSNMVSEDEMYEYYAIRISTARCAQVSYTTVGEDGKPMNYPKLIELQDRLAASGHWSPFEHCAECMGESMESRWIKSPGNQHGWCGNFRGWKQYRKTFDNENRSDERLIKKKYDGNK